MNEQSILRRVGQGGSLMVIVPAIEQKDRLNVNFNKRYQSIAITEVVELVGWSGLLLAAAKIRPPVHGNSRRCISTRAIEWHSATHSMDWISQPDSGFRNDIKRQDQPVPTIHKKIIAKIFSIFCCLDVL